MHLSKQLGSRLGAGILTASLLITPAFAASGTVTAENGLRLRSDTSTSSDIIDTLPSGQRVDVLEAVGCDWYRVSADGRQGYVSSAHIALESAAAPAPDAPKTAAAAPRTGVVTASSLNIRSGPGADYARVGALSSGTQVTLLEQTGDWYRIENGYISASYVRLTDSGSTAQPNSTPLIGLVSASTLNIRSGPGSNYEKVGSLSSGAQVTLLEKAGDWYRIEKGYISAQYVIVKSDNVSELQAQIVAFARSLLGKPYVWGGSGPNEFDCSGLTQYIYKQFGYSIYRNATSQLKNGVPVSKENLQPGDLVFFNSSFTGADKASHIGIYIGNGQFIHASGKTLADGSKRPVVIGDLNTAYYIKVYTTARRII